MAGLTRALATIALAAALSSVVGAQQKATVDHWIGLLGSDSYADREEATQALAKLGPSALPKLRQAEQSGDPEVKRRARDLLRRIERQTEAERILAPQRVRLIYKDTPIAEAIADFASLSGFVVQLKGDKRKLAEQRIALDTGDTTFWDAFNQLRERARLREDLTASAQQRASAEGGAGTTVIVRNGNLVLMRDLIGAGGNELQTSLVLLEGAAPPPPSCFVGAVRICALPAAVAARNVMKPGNDTLVALQVTVEPRLQWQRIVGVRVAKAIDEHDQELVYRVALPKEKQVIVQRDGVIVNDEDASANPREALVRLSLAGKRARLLKQLTGTIAAHVRPPPEVLVSIKDVFKAGDRTFKGEAGSTLKVLEIAQDGGVVRLRVLVEAPPSEIDDGSMDTTNPAMVISGPFADGKSDTLTARNFALLDADGKAFPVIKALHTGKRLGSAQELELTYQTGKGLGEPSRFVFSGRRSAIVDVPFTLTNVPLP